MQWQGYGIGRHRGSGLLTQHVAYASEQINEQLIQNITTWTASTKKKWRSDTLADKNLRNPSRKAFDLKCTARVINFFI
jgi:hypothetical protein